MLDRGGGIIYPKSVVTGQRIPPDHFNPWYILAHATLSPGLKSKVYSGPLHRTPEELGGGYGYTKIDLADACN